MKSGQAICADQIHFHYRKESGADNRIVRQGIHVFIILYAMDGIPNEGNDSNVMNVMSSTTHR
jgi:hypothetical protein